MWECAFSRRICTSGRIYTGKGKVCEIVEWKGEGSGVRSKEKKKRRKKWEKVATNWRVSKKKRNEQSSPNGTIQSNERTKCAHKLCLRKGPLTNNAQRTMIFLLRWLPYRERKSPLFARREGWTMPRWQPPFSLSTSFTVLTAAPSFSKPSSVSAERLNVTKGERESVRKMKGGSIFPLNWVATKHLKQPELGKVPHSPALPISLAPVRFFLLSVYPIRLFLHGSLSSPPFEPLHKGDKTPRSLPRTSQIRAIATKKLPRNFLNCYIGIAYKSPVSSSLILFDRGEKPKRKNKRQWKSSLHQLLWVRYYSRGREGFQVDHWERGGVSQLRAYLGDGRMW